MNRGHFYVWVAWPIIAVVRHNGETFSYHWWLIPPFIDPVMEQKSVSHTYFPRGDPGLSNPREEDTLEAMVSSKLKLKCQIQLLIGSSKKIVIYTLIIKRGTGMRS